MYSCADFRVALLLLILKYSIFTSKPAHSGTSETKLTPRANVFCGNDRPTKSVWIRFNKMKQKEARRIRVSKYICLLMFVSYPHFTTGVFVSLSVIGRVSGLVNTRWSYFVQLNLTIHSVRTEPDKIVFRIRKSSKQF